MIKIGGLWSNKSEKTGTYLTGGLGNARMVIFKNTFKKAGSTDPDYTLYIDVKQSKEAVADLDEENPFVDVLIRNDEDEEPPQPE